MPKSSLSYRPKPNNRMLKKIDADIIEQLRAGDIIIQDNKKYKIHALSGLEIMAMSVEESQLKMLPVLSLISEDWHVEKN
ncbi:MAG TPA: hypothetical protein VHZ50_01365, partial [Puia sp.]|nr:hypothetical protein [Puia sp.]